MKTRVVYYLNVLAFLAVIAILGAASFMQWYYHELPCPLCLLQRVGFCLMGLGFMMNLLHRVSSRYYALSLIASLYTAAVGLRQILLHILPGAAGYGVALFGLHMYTWTFCIAVGYVLFISILLTVYDHDGPAVSQVRSKYWLRVVLGLFLFILFYNLLSVFLECGIGACPDNPVRYYHHLL